MAPNRAGAHDAMRMRLNRTLLRLLHKPKATHNAYTLLRHTIAFFGPDSQRPQLLAAEQDLWECYKVDRLYRKWDEAGAYKCWLFNTLLRRLR